MNASLALTCLFVQKSKLNSDKRQERTFLHLQERGHRTEGLMGHRWPGFGEAWSGRWILQKMVQYLTKLNVEDRKHENIINESYSQSCIETLHERRSGNEV